MKALAKRFSPSATDLLRSDHTRVVAVFRRYAADLSPRLKRGLVENACLMLEMHAQIEEEILYPQMRSADPVIVDQSVPEHDEMRRLIATLRGTDPATPDYDETFFNLMHVVLHHVADEESKLFPDAERLFPRKWPAWAHGSRSAVCSWGRRAWARWPVPPRARCRYRQSRSPWPAF
jgi:hypothetical protein